MDQVNLPGLEICAQFCVHVHVCTHTHARGKPECRCSLEQKKERLESSWDHGMWTVWEKKRVSHPCHIPKRKTEPCVQYTWRQTQGGTMNSFPSRVYKRKLTIDRKSRLGLFWAKLDWCTCLPSPPQNKQGLGGKWPDSQEYLLEWRLKSVPCPPHAGVFPAAEAPARRCPGQ